MCVPWRTLRLHSCRTWLVLTQLVLSAARVGRLPHLTAQYACVCAQANTL